MPLPLTLLVLAMFGTFIYLALRGARRDEEADRREEAGQCPRRGYDLRAAPDYCPECGRKPPMELDEAPSIPGDSAPVRPRLPGMEEMLVEVYRTSNVLEADLLTERLTLQGVLCESSGSRMMARGVRPDVRLCVWTQ